MEGSNEAMDVDRGEMSAINPESMQVMQVGLLLFGNDFAAITDTLLPGKTVEELVEFYCSRYVYSKAHAHVSALKSAGFQPGSILSGNMRNKVFQRISTASERPLKMDRVLMASFKAYDACTLPLLDLAKAILRTTDAAAFARAVYEQLPTCGVDLEQLSLTAELCLDWPALEAKIRETPTLFEAALWPALAACGWKREPASAATSDRAATSASAAAGCRSISRDDVATNPDDAVAGQQQQEPASLAPSPATPLPSNPGSAVFVPPPAVTAACKPTTAKRLPCTPLAVVELLKASGQPVPADCIQRLRQLELPAAVDECLALTGAWSHRTAVDPAAKRPATPNSSRKFMCANCAVGSSTVWRAGNAGLTLCNACGMFYNKHDHEHRPEHLVESARVKAAAAASAAATAAADTGACQGANSPACGKRCSLPARFTPDSLDCGDLSDDAAAFCYGRHGSFLAAAGGGAGGLSDSGDEEEEGAAGSRRPRTRRRTQANRWLAADDYLLLDGPTRPAESGGGGSGRGMPDSFDGGRTRGGSGSPVRRQRRATRGLGSPSGGSTGRSMDAEGFGGKDFQQEGPFYPTVRGASAGGRRSRRHEWQGDEQGCKEEGAVASRRTEGLEALLSRVLINSPSDASDASAADALVCMSHASLTRQEQRRLAASLSCDTRSGSLSPAPPAASRLALAAAAALAAARRDGHGPAAEGTAGPVPCVGDGGGAASGTDDEDEAGSREQQQPRCTAGGGGEPRGWRFSSIGFDAAAQLAIKFIPSLAAAVGPGGDGDGCGIIQGDGEATDAGDTDAMETDGPGGEGACCHGVDGFEQAWAAVQVGRRAGSCRAGAGSPGWQHPATTAAAAPLQQSPSDPLLLLHEAAAGLDGAAHYGQDFNRTYHQQQQQKWQQQQELAEALMPRSLSCPPMRSGSGGSPVGSLAAASGSRSPQPHRSQPQPQPQQQQQEDLEPALRSTSSSTSMRNKALSRFAAEHQQQQEFSGARPSSPGVSKQPPGGRSPSAGRGGSASPRIARTHTPTGEPIRCANCSCEQTCLWRKDKEKPGRTLCNACGIYKTNNGIDRPTNGLFPTWKNGRERVVRRNTAARPFKPYFTPQQQQQQHEVAATGLQAAIHPGALLLAAGEQQQEPVAQTHHVAGLAGTAACVTAVACGRVDAASAPLVGSGSSALSEAGTLVLAPAAQTTRVMSLGSAQMNALPGMELGSAGSGDRQATLQRISSSAAAAAAAAMAAAAGLQGHARGSGGGGGSDSGRCIGWAQQLGPQSPGLLADLVRQAWTSAVRGGEPVLLPTGHMVLSSGQVVVGGQVNNQLQI